MPRFDGTGPKGLGPMSGGGRGFCVLKMSQRSEEPVTGFAGEAGWPVGGFLSWREAELANLKARNRQIETTLRAIRRRIELLEANRKETMTGACRRMRKSSSTMPADQEGSRL